MNIIVDEVLQHLESSLSAKIDYSDVHKSLNFLFQKSLNGKKLECIMHYIYFLYFFVFQIFISQF